MNCLLLRHEKNLNVCRKYKERIKEYVEAGITTITTLADEKTTQGCPKSDFICTTYEELSNMLKGRLNCIQTKVALWL
jgi:uncharacterized protein YaaR (DUF327 family)